MFRAALRERNCRNPAIRFQVRHRPVPFSPLRRILRILEACQCIAPRDLVGFQLRHFEQIAEHVVSVTT